MTLSKSSILFLLYLTISLITSSATFTPVQSQPSVPPSILNACDALANSGRLSMSLMLQLIAPDLNLPSPIVLTVFAPPDSAFTDNGQPSWAQLSLHLSPVTVSSSLLQFSTTLPCLTPNKHLIISSNTVNGVQITQSPIFDDGFVVVYGIDTFLDLDYEVNNSSVVTIPDFSCLEVKGSIFDDAATVMESRGHSIMATFLRLQILGYGYESEKDNVRMTVFAPMEEDLVQFSAAFLDYVPILKRHVLASCKVDWNGVNGLGNGTVIPNYEDDSLQFTKNEDSGMVMVNGIEITTPDMYESDWFVIHGIGGLISVPVVETESLVSPSLEGA